jgi:NAD(P)-dependent dehydrogenase (short-subunit alcohol dehydrogenase family)
MQRILITGASRGIGRAIAARLASPDTTLLLHGRDFDGLAATADLVARAGARTETLSADLADPAATVDLAERALAGGPVDVLVNNAGVPLVKDLGDIGLEEWQRAVAVNLTAPFLLVQTLAPAMPRGGSVVNVSSVAGRSAFPGWSAYCATKFGLEGFSAAVREELRAAGVRVINVYPAATATDLWDHVDGDFDRSRMMPPEETAEAVAYALSRPAGVLVDSIQVGGLGGKL